jgi:hypothetical protein
LRLREKKSKYRTGLFLIVSLSGGKFEAEWPLAALIARMEKTPAQKRPTTSLAPCKEDFEAKIAD